MVGVAKQIHRLLPAVFVCAKSWLGLCGRRGKRRPSEVSGANAQNSRAAAHPQSPGLDAGDVAVAWGESPGTFC